MLWRIIWSDFRRTVHTRCLLLSFPRLWIYLLTSLGSYCRRQTDMSSYKGLRSCYYETGSLLGNLGGLHRLGDQEPKGLRNTKIKRVLGSNRPNVSLIDLRFGAARGRSSCRIGIVPWRCPLCHVTVAFGPLGSYMTG